MSRPPCFRAAAFSLFMASATLASPGIVLACEGNPWIRLEVTAGEMAGDQAAEWVEIDRSGCVLSGYPSWDTRAGVYQRTMSHEEKNRLGMLLKTEQILSFDEKAQRSAIRSAESKAGDGPFARHVFAVSGGDQYRLLLDNGGHWKSITWLSPKLELTHRREISAKAGNGEALLGLQRLVNVLDAVQQSGNHPAKTRITEATP